MARTYHVRFKAPRKRSHRQAKSGEAINRSTHGRWRVDAVRSGSNKRHTSDVAL